MAHGFRARAASEPGHFSSRILLMKSLLAITLSLAVLVSFASSVDLLTTQKTLHRFHRSTRQIKDPQHVSKPVPTVVAEPLGTSEVGLCRQQYDSGLGPNAPVSYPNLTVDGTIILPSSTIFPTTTRKPTKTHSTTLTLKDAPSTLALPTTEASSTLVEVTSTPVEDPVEDPVEVTSAPVDDFTTPVEVASPSVAVAPPPVVVATPTPVEISEVPQAGGAFFGIRGPDGGWRRRRDDPSPPPDPRAGGAGLTRYLAWKDVDCADFNKKQMNLVNVPQVSELSVDLIHAFQSPRPIVRNFIGFSTEYDDWDVEMTDFDKIYPPALVKGLQILTETNEGVGIPYLVGGNSAMHVALSDSKLPKIEDSDIVLPPTYYHMIKTLVDKINSKATIALPMMSRSPDYAVEVALRVAEVFGEERLFAFELGNEPDHWIKKEKCYRNLTWVADDYFHEAKNLAVALRQAWPDDFPLNLQGPALVGCNTNPLKICWWYRLLRFGDISDDIKFLSFHRYGVSGCNPATNIRNIMADPIPGQPRTEYTWARDIVEEAEQNGKEVIWSEGNVFSCGGNKCLSGSVASALWLMDNYLEAAHAGVSRNMLHAHPEHAYSPYIYREDGSHQVDFMPTFYGVLALLRLIKSDQTYVFRPQINTDSYLYKTWGIKDEESGDVKIVFIHKDIDQLEPLKVTINANNVAPGTLFNPTGYVWRVEADDGYQIVDNKTKIAEQRILPNGEWDGEYTVETVTAVEGSNGGQWEIFVNPGTVAVLELTTQTHGDFTTPSALPDEKIKTKDPFDAIGKASPLGSAAPTLLIEPNVHYFGEVIQSMYSVPNSDECYIHCQQTAPACQYFAYKKSKRICSLLRSQTNAVPNQPDYVSGRMGEMDQTASSVMLDPTLPGFVPPVIGWQGGEIVERMFYQGTEPSMNDNGDEPNFNMAQKCSQACIGSESCLSFNINLNTGECQLANAIAGFSPGKELATYDGIRYNERVDAKSFFRPNKKRSVAKVAGL